MYGRAQIPDLSPAAAAFGSTGSEVSMIKSTGATIKKSVVELYHAALQPERQNQCERKLQGGTTLRASRIMYNTQ